MYFFYKNMKEHSNSTPFRFNFGLLVYALIFLVTFTVPFMFARYYYAKGSYDELVVKIIRTSDEVERKIYNISKAHTLLAVVLWAFWAAFIIHHWLPVFKASKPPVYMVIACVLMLFFGIGWWVSWLSIYSFICHVHYTQIVLFEEHMKDCYRRSTKSKDAEEDCCLEILKSFNDLKLWLDQSQVDFATLVSYSFTFLLMGMAVFTAVYWNRAFENEYSIIEYCIIVVLYVLAILMKLYPAAMVGVRLRNIVVLAGNSCLSDFYTEEKPVPRFVLYEHLVIREQHCGLCILGVSLRSKITVFGFLILIAASLTFIKVVVPYI